MDSYTIALLSVLILAIQGLGLHSIFTLYSNEGKLRQTLVNQGRELIQLRNTVKQLSERQSVDATTVEALQEDQPLTTAEARQQPLDTGESLEDLIARYEMDEAEAWYLLQQRESEERNPTVLN